jgi:hypothetical protein
MFGSTSQPLKTRDHRPSRLIFGRDGCMMAGNIGRECAPYSRASNI